jgi:hypothetical protein
MSHLKIWMESKNHSCKTAFYKQVIHFTWMENVKWGWGNIKTNSTQALLLLQISDFSLDFILFLVFYIKKWGEFWGFCLNSTNFAKFFEKVNNLKFIYFPPNFAM